MIVLYEDISREKDAMWNWADNLNTKHSFRLGMGKSADM